MNDCILEATDDEQESIILQVAAGQMDKETFTEWVKSKIKPL
jgi:prophage maintenance system killer protein